MQEIGLADLIDAIGNSDFALVEQTGIRSSEMSRTNFLEHFCNIALPVIDPGAKPPSAETFRYWNSGIVLAKSSDLLELSKFALDRWSERAEAHLVGDHMVADQDYFQYWGSVKKPGSITTLPCTWNHCYWWDLDYPRADALIHHYSNFCLGPDETTLSRMRRDSDTSGFTAAIISFNSASQLNQSVASAFESGAKRVLVWDNGSNDKSVEVARQAGAEVICSPENLGFARAANALIALSTTKYVVLINPDAKLDNETASHALSLLDNPKVIAAAPDQEVPGHLRIPALQSGYTRRRLMAEIIFPRLTVTGSGGFVERVLGVGRSTWFWSSGACLFVNRDLFLEIGGFDERLFMYMEDVAFGKAAYRNGYEIRATGTSFIHRMSTGSEISNRERVSHLTRARIQFARENYRVVGPIAFLIGKIKGIF